MRVYHFLSALNAIDDLTRGRIKLSEIDKLNDPFELWCSAQGDRQIRLALHLWKKQMALTFGILCFSRRWNNPVLWSHYADGHRGICLGFEIADDGLLKSVRYVSERSELPMPPTAEAMEELLFTKYRDWSYEEELRGWFELKERDATGHYFYTFDDKIRLCEVITGPLYDSPKATIDVAIKSYHQEISVIRARLAFRSFQIVEDKRGFAELR